MATTRLITKNSSTPGKAPGDGDILKGELALNLADQKLYSKDADGTVFEVGSKNSASDLQQVTDAGNTTTNKIVTASTGAGDSGGTVVTKDYLESAGGGTGTFGYWSRSGTDLSPANSGDTITSAGDVKIGGTSSDPNIELDNSGSAAFKKAGTQIIEIENTSNAGNAEVQLKLDSHTLRIGANSSANFFDESGANPFVWSQSAGERMRLNYEGNLLIGPGGSPTVTIKQDGSITAAVFDLESLDPLPGTSRRKLLQDRIEERRGN